MFDSLGPFSAHHSKGEPAVVSFSSHGTWQMAVATAPRREKVDPARLSVPPIKQGAALVATVAVHVALVTIVLPRLAPPPIIPEPERPITLVNLAEPVSAEELEPASELRDADVAVAPPPPPVPREWTRVALRSLPAQPSAGSAAGSGGGSDYDPFAGAAPQRRPATQGRLVLDEERLRVIQRRIADSLPHERGAIWLTVVVSGSGAVVSVEVRQSDGVTAQLIGVAMRMLMGEVLFHRPLKTVLVQRYDLPALVL